MNSYQGMNLDQLKDELIRTAKKAYPLFIIGALYWFVMGLLGLFLEQKLTALISVIGMGSIFPLGTLLGKLLKADIMSSNPLGVIGGLIGGIQLFFIPIWVVIYIEHPEWIPMSIGMMSGAHFLPYVWLYKSKTYLFQTIATVLVAFIGGYIFMDQAFLVVPFGLTLVYLITVIGLVAETGSYIRSNPVNKSV
ncbi:hypothetical protein PAE9249_03031 [Paenibacillus sp. CECT 9249]|uniref:DUF7010 family protein n=1 Tax=Paenibacillus sp. CECT 9249 TaxID=2845385 RepID=UPI001E63D82B|nr:hypothetical protein [Paenibacillus sp. CECT 9249]CAH0120512.1 hypothetical protein PAE9249_03031 [Paenibacillus sp. CECT 9249]